MRIWYDTEFLEDGNTIELISIGMVREDGQRLYAINSDCNFNRVHHHDWLRSHVLPHLPVQMQIGGGWLIDKDHPDARFMEGPWQIAAQVRAMVLGAGEPELWAWYGAYDHVVLCQLFGPMIKLPDGFPMWTNDLKQEQVRLGISDVDLPMQARSGAHNALADALWLQDAHLWLEKFDREG